MIGGLLMGWQDTGRREPAEPGQPEHQVWALLVTENGGSGTCTMCIHAHLTPLQRADLTLGDSVWWQQRVIYHTSVQGGPEDRPLDKVGYSHAVKDCGCWPQFSNPMIGGTG